MPAPPDPTTAPAARGAVARSAAAGARVLVLWTGFRAGAQTCAALARAGFDVLPAHPAGDPGGASRRARRPERYPAPSAGAGAVLAWLADRCARGDVDAVLPLDEDLVRLLAERPPPLGGARLVGPDAAQYAALCDKHRLVATAAAAGVDHPATITVTASGPDGPWPALPSMVKPVVSRSDMSLAAITVARDERERSRQVGRLLDAGLDALVQERVEGRRWVVHCVRGADGLLAVPSRIELDWPRGTGVACVQRSHPRPPPGLVEGVARLLRHAGYRGPATVSSLRSGGRLLVHDVNLRVGASVGLMIRSGLDIPRLAVEEALGVPLAAPRWRPTRYVWLDGELGALAAALRGGGAGAAARVAARIAAAALRPAAMTDPSPLDPWWLRERAASLPRRLSRLRRGGRAGG
ncbi:hypothetical protein [Miltoncostaea marina]|uniref:hypothetical protein n=1 Tax=Miltoncostaea marina TaxID=2843215 RepID=UPI001C3D74E9|nr:hypothetical protein [Miltoncostaea marina]